MSLFLWVKDVVEELGCDEVVVFFSRIFVYWDKLYQKDLFIRCFRSCQL